MNIILTSLKCYVCINFLSIRPKRRSSVRVLCFHKKVNFPNYFQSASMKRHMPKCPRRRNQVISQGATATLGPSVAQRTVMAQGPSIAQVAAMALGASLAALETVTEEIIAAEQDAPVMQVAEVSRALTMAHGTSMAQSPEAHETPASMHGDVSQGYTMSPDTPTVELTVIPPGTARKSDTAQKDRAQDIEMSLDTAASIALAQRPSMPPPANLAQETAMAQMTAMAQATAIAQTTAMAQATAMAQETVTMPASLPVAKLNSCRVCGMQFQYKSALLEHCVR